MPLNLFLFLPYFNPYLLCFLDISVTEQTGALPHDSLTHDPTISVEGNRFFFSFKKDIIYLFLERGEKREKEREKNINVREIHRLVASHMPPTGGLAGNPGMCPDWDSNW